jgi:hypothetical protein
VRARLVNVIVLCIGLLGGAGVYVAWALLRAWIRDGA